MMISEEKFTTAPEREKYENEMRGNIYSTRDLHCVLVRSRENQVAVA